MSFKSIFFYILLGFSGLFSSFSQAEQLVIAKHISTHQSIELIENNADNPEFEIIDVRTVEEFNSGHIAGASYIDFYKKDFQHNLAKLDKDKTYLLYCRTGRRSGIALDMMKTMGFTHSYNMLGGITQWTAAKLPVEK